MADPNQKRVLLAYVALRIGIVCIGFSAIFVKIAGVPGVVSAFYRVLIAGVVIVPWGMLRHAKHPTPKETILIASWGVFLALDLALWNTSLLLTFAARATLLANNALLWDEATHHPQFCRCCRELQPLSYGAMLGDRY
jgi:hypothetical protein